MGWAGHLSQSVTATTLLALPTIVAFCPRHAACPTRSSQQTHHTRANRSAMELCASDHDALVRGWYQAKCIRIGLALSDQHLTQSVRCCDSRCDDATKSTR
eukprot:1644575-Rhodomonas_salina.4